MTLIWGFKVSKGQTGYAILFATYDFLSVFYSNYGDISHGNPVFQLFTSIWISRSSKVKLIMPSDSRPMTCYWCSIVTISLSRTRTLFFSWSPRSDLPRSPKVKLIVPFYSRLMTSYLCFIVTIALFRTETLFFSRWPRSDLPRSPKVKVIMPSDSRPITCY